MSSQRTLIVGRRRFLCSAAAGAALFTTPGAFAEELTRTPRQTEGPFYPDKLPLDTDNDLLVLNDSITPAVGEVTHLTGRVTSPSGEPLRNVVVEIWQVDKNGVYIHTQCPNKENEDKNFQGFGRFLTDSTGRYYFRTIKPPAYPGRAPHIHVAVNKGGKRMLTTQLYVKGAEENERDGVLRGMRDPKQRESVIIEFKPLAESQAGELTANFDIVMGLTPEDRGQDPFRRRRVGT